jgi:hypothetical protein
VKEWVRLEDSSKYTKPFLNDKDRTAMKEAAKLIMEKLNKEVG